MAHTPLLIGADGQGLSKRLGSLSIDQLREKGIDPVTIASLLAKLGTSDNIEIRKSLDELAAEFSFDKIGRAPARFDENDLTKLNSSLLSDMSFEVVSERLNESDALKGRADLKLFWDTIRDNISSLNEVSDWADILFGEVETSVDDEDKEYIAAASSSVPASPYDDTTWSSWTGALKEQTGRKGRGLFMPLRKALTGRERGPEMNKVLVLLGEERAKARLVKASG